MLINSINAIRTNGKFIRIASMRDEHDIDIADPMQLVEQIKTSPNIRADVFTFCQRLPNIIPKYSYHLEWDSIAVLEYKDHKYWFERILDDKTRNMIRRAEKKRVVTKIVDFDDNLVQGILEIYNESPIRQGRLFWHYGKTFDEVKKANATHLERSTFIGAYHEQELIGFIKLAYGDRTARAEQIISKIKHRDKAPTNKLVDRAVMLCEERQLPYLIYGIWPRKESFAQFKRNNGFKRIDLPRYFIPLNMKGRIVISLKLHREFKQFIPEGIKERLADLRARWYESRYRSDKRI